MSEFLGRASKSLAAMVAIGMFAAGCSKSEQTPKSMPAQSEQAATPIRDRFVHHLNCALDRHDAAGTIFHNVKPGEAVKVGHVRLDTKGAMASDFIVKISAEGTPTAVPSTNDPGARIEPEKAGIRLTEGDEAHLIIGKIDASGGQLDVQSQCVTK